MFERRPRSLRRQALSIDANLAPIVRVESEDRSGTLGPPRPDEAVHPDNFADTDLKRHVLEHPAPTKPPDIKRDPLVVCQRRRLDANGDIPAHHQPDDSARAGIRRCLRRD